MSMEYSAKDANKLYFHNQDGMDHSVSTILIVIALLFVKITGILDMFVPIVVLLSITDQLTATAMDPSCGAIAVHVILMKLENSQDHAIMSKFLRVLNHAAAMVSFAANLQSFNTGMTSGEIAIAD